MGNCIGIDLGTTNSVVAVMEGETAKIITNEEGNRTTPSVVAYQKDGEILVGQVARRQAVTNPENTVFSIKRFMGRKFEEVSEEITLVPYKVFKADNGDAQVEVMGKSYSPPEISAKVLQKLRRAAEAYLGEEVDEAVITVPAYFNDSQRQATKDAGTIAGLKVKRIVNEPTAAALAYGLEKKKDQVIAVYDFGGGTFDISILEVGENVVEAISTNGDTHLGGDNIDQRIIDYLAAEFKRDQGLDVSNDKMVIQRLKEAAEKAKIELSSALETDINLPFLTADQSGPKHLNMKLTRAKLESLCEDLILRSLEPVKLALEDAKKKPSDIDEVLLVGGTTRIPRVQQEVKKYFGKEPNRSVNPDEVVAIGAATQAAVLSGDVEEVLLLDVTPLSLGVETGGGVFTPLIKRNTTIPTRKRQIFTTSLDNQNFVPVHVLQGERKMSADNTTLAKFELTGIPPAPRGVPQIEVSFDIDSNGIVSVTAKDLGTGKQQIVRVAAGSGLTEADIDRIVADAEEQKTYDEERKKLAEARAAPETLIYTSERAVEEYGEVVSGEELEVIRADITALKEVLEGDDIALIGEFKTQLEASAFRIAEAMYASVDAGDADDYDETDADYLEDGDGVPGGDDPAGDGGDGPAES